MESHELIQLIHHGREERNLEYKGCVNWKAKKVQASIIKTILAMSNITDGGVIIVGVEEKDEEFLPVGLEQQDLETFTQDGVSARVNEFADPYVEITVSRVPDQGMDFIVIQVEEFIELPVICKQDWLRGLRRGAIFTRPRRMHETAEVSSQVEMREIIDRASEKGIRYLYRRLGRAGLEVVETEERDRQLFEEQLGNL